MYKNSYFSHSNVWCRKQILKEDDSPALRKPRTRCVTQSLVAISIKLGGMPGPPW